MIKAIAFFNEPEANIEEAGRLANQVLSNRRLSPQVAKAAHIAYTRLGRIAEAKAAVEKMVTANPKITIQTWRRGFNFRDPSVLDQLAADLARAGLPDRATR